MGGKWVYQPSYSTRRSSYVRGSWQFRECANSDGKKSAYRHSCPVCGEEIISVRMKNRGWVHYFGQKGMTRYKHPCQHRMDAYSKAQDDDTLDLFAIAELAIEESALNASQL